MKKFVSGAVAFALLSSMSMVTVPTAVSAQGASDRVEFCKRLVDRGIRFETVGECVSFYRTRPVEFCKWLKEIDRLQPRWKNQGQCIKFFRHR